MIFNIIWGGCTRPLCPPWDLRPCTAAINAKWKFLGGALMFVANIETKELYTSLCLSIKLDCSNLFLYIEGWDGGFLYVSPFILLLIYPAPSSDSPTDLRPISSLRFTLPPPIPWLLPPRFDLSLPPQQPHLSRTVRAIRVLLLWVGQNQRLYLQTWMTWRWAAQQDSKPKENCMCFSRVIAYISISSCEQYCRWLYHIKQ